MKKVLVLGAGYVGTALYNQSTLSQFSDKTEYILHSKKTLDYTNSAILNKFLFNNGITHVVNCSGFTGRPNVDQAETNKKECWELNVTIPLQVSKICKGLCIEYIHISSGCIFSGYKKEFTELDEPNFGVFNDSSFYSKTKHTFELLNDYGCTIRVRMPFCGTTNERSYLHKILKYDNLINYVNSKTHTQSLVDFIVYFISSYYKTSDVGIINFVNPEPLDTREVTRIMTLFDTNNPNWKFVDMDDLKLAAPRSNCVLSMDKFKKLFPDFYVETEREALTIALNKK